MAVENLVSSFLSAWNTQPIQALTAGEGVGGITRTVSDTVAPTITGVASVGSSYRLCRFPVQAKIKRVLVNLSGGDTNAAVTLAYDINVAFSDSLFDGTQQAFTPNNGLTEATATGIPTTALNGAVTSITTYASPNILFGNVKGANTTGLLLQSDQTFAGSTLAASWRFNGVNLPLWDYFGFLNAQGFAQDPSGFFDLVFRVSNVAATAAAGLISAEVTYVL